MEQKICIITGANSGIGKQAACLIAQQQVHVIMACRNRGRAEKACQDILSVDSSMSLEIMILDMADNISIKQSQIIKINNNEFYISQEEEEFLKNIPILSQKGFVLISLFCSQDFEGILIFTLFYFFLTEISID